MRWLIATLATLLLLVIACDSDDDSDTTIEPDPTIAATLPPDTGEGSRSQGDTELGSVDAVRELIGSVSDLEPGLIRDVELDDRKLTIMLTEDDSFADTNDVETICDDLNQAIGFSDLEIVIESSSGSQLAQCRFTG